MLGSRGAILLWEGKLGACLFVFFSFFSCLCVCARSRSGVKLGWCVITFPVCRSWRESPAVCSLSSRSSKVKRQAFHLRGRRDDSAHPFPPLHFIFLPVVWKLSEILFQLCDTEREKKKPDVSFVGEQKRCKQLQSVFDYRLQITRYQIFSRKSKPFCILYRFFLS